MQYLQRRVVIFTIEIKIKSNTLINKENPLRTYRNI